jgi:ribosomal protein S27AE
MPPMMSDEEQMAHRKTSFSGGDSTGLWKPTKYCPQCGSSEITYPEHQGRVRRYAWCGKCMKLVSRKALVKSEDRR